MRVNRAWLGLAVLMLPTLLVAMDMTALLLALPRLSASLHVTGVIAAVIFAGLAALTLAMRPATRTTPAMRAGHEATRPCHPAEADVADACSA